MADLPFDVQPELTERLARQLDAEGKILRALEALGPLAGRDVLLAGGDSALRSRQLSEHGARLATPTASGANGHLPYPDASVDAIVGWWSAFRGVDPLELAEADRVLRPGGRILAIHDYGRDDLSRLRADDRPEYGLWSRRDGPFLSAGFKIRVIHCWWTFESLDEAAEMLGAAFGETGTSFAASLRRPRLSYNVAIYHRTRGDAAA